MPAQSREARIYLAMWRKAYRDSLSPNPPPCLKVNTSNLSMALAMKKGLYRAIKPYREGTLIDDELRIAADGFIIAVPREANGPAWLEIRPRQTLSELEAQLSSLGLDDQELLSPEERRLAQNLDQFISDDPVVPLPVKRSTPFYTRED